MRSRLTITRTGNPGRIVSVGWILRLRRTTCCPVWFSEFAAPKRSAWRMAVLLPLSAPDPSSAPTPRIGRQQCGLEQFTPMIVDLVLKTRITAGVCPLLSFQNDRSAVRHDQPGPHQQHPRLAECDLAVIDADQARTLRDQLGAASWGIIDIFGDLRCDLSGKIRADACDESGRDDRSRLHHKWRRWT